MASPYIQYSEIVAIAQNGGYNQNPALSQISAVFLLSSCLVMSQRWLWQNPIDPISESEFQDILSMIETAESELMESVNLGQIVPSVSNMDSDIYLRLDGSIVAQADYPELYDVVPVSWLVGTNIQLPDMYQKSVHGGDVTNVGSIEGDNEVVLSVDEMPSHSHTQDPHSHSYVETTSVPTAAGLEPTFADLTTNIPSVTGTTVAINNPTGGGQPHNNVPESLIVHWWIVAR